MKKRAILMLTTLAAGMAAASPISARQQEGSGTPATGDTGGALRTLDHGRWSCALPGDAAGAAWNPVPEADFSIGPSSSYETRAGRGTYILRGRILTFTRGPKKGERFEQVGRNTLEVIEPDGENGRLTCTRVGGPR
ncbi:MAG: elongation factor P [Erythrobacter sp.]|uniref:elongation factor P n=1 Tax=Erythrobacter sp. TaxID=1042 RepID=UPI0032EFF6F4